MRHRLLVVSGLALGAALAVSVGGGSAAERAAPLRLSTGSLDFGQVAVGTTGRATIVVAAAMGKTGTAIAVTIAAPAPFSVAGRSFSLRPGAKRTVTLGFAPTVAGLASGVVTVTAKGASARVKVRGTGVPTISSASTTSPVPMTSLQLKTAGFDTGKAVDAAWSNGSGFSFTDTAARVQRDGTVTLAVPLYVDKSTGAIGPGAVSLVLSQGGSQTAPLAVNIGDVPPLSTYSVKLGEISHAFLVYETLLLGRRIGELQAAQLELGTDTSAAVDALSSLFTSTVMARNDVDRIMLDNSTVIQDPLAGGGTITFDKSSVDMMDRTFALYLLQEFGGGARVLQSRHRAHDQVETILTTLDSANGLISIVKHVQGAATAGSTLDSALLMTHAVKDQLDLFPTPATAPLAAALGAGLAIVDVGRAGIDALYDLGTVYVDSKYGGDPAALAQDYKNLDSDSAKLLENSVNALTAGCFSKLKASLGSDNPTIQSLGLARAEADLLDSLASADQTSDEVAGEIKNPFPSPAKGFGVVDGTAAIANDQGAAASQSSLDLCCFGTAATGLVGVADTSGAYDEYVPLGVPGTDYTSMTVDAYDWVTGSTLGTTPVDLSGLSSGGTTTAGTITGQCIDNDALNPDADDPDCD